MAAGHKRQRVDSRVSSFSSRGKHSSSGAGSGDAEDHLTDSGEDDEQVSTASILLLYRRPLWFFLWCTVFVRRGCLNVLALESFAPTFAVLSGYLGRVAYERLNYTPATLVAVLSASMVAKGSILERNRLPNSVLPENSSSIHPQSCVLQQGCKKEWRSSNAMPPSRSHLIRTVTKKKKVARSKEANAENTVPGSSGSANCKQGDGQAGETTADLERDGLVTGCTSGRELETETATNNATVSVRIFSL